VIVPASSDDVRVRDLGSTDYTITWRAMQAFTRARTAGSQDEVWVTTHPPVYTLGLAGRREHLRRDNGIPVVQVDRGGQVTYHGPGQAVLYLLFDLRRLRLPIRTMVRAIEEAVVEWLDSLGISAYGKPSAPGVYVRRETGEAKIAALGLRVSNGCTYHGLAVNLAMDLAPFSDIDPCGYAGLAVTQVADFIAPEAIPAIDTSLAPIVARRVLSAAEHKR
jgi:lipoyl(octanoyl) transferase